MASDELMRLLKCGTKWSGEFDIGYKNELMCQPVSTLVCWTTTLRGAEWSSLATATSFSLAPTLALTAW